MCDGVSSRSSLKKRLMLIRLLKYLKSFANFNLDVFPNFLPSCIGQRYECVFEVRNSEQITAIAVLGMHER